jgi:uncharacterized protein YuzE
MNPLHYFETEGALHLLIKEGNDSQGVEISPHITAEINAQGKLIDIEILNAIRFLRNFILESVQAKLMQLRLSV